MRPVGILATVSILLQYRLATPPWLLSLVSKHSAGRVHRMPRQTGEEIFTNEWEKIPFTNPLLYLGKEGSNRVCDDARVGLRGRMRVWKAEEDHRLPPAVGFGWFRLHNADAGPHPAPTSVRLRGQNKGDRVRRLTAHVFSIAGSVCESLRRRRHSEDDTSC